MSSVIVLALLITITKCMEFDSINDLAEDAFVVQCIGQNEQFDLCGNNCEMTCQNLGLPAPHTDLSSTWAGCEPGCYCKIGYIRNGFGNCVEHNAFSCLGKFCVFEKFGKNLKNRFFPANGTTNGCQHSSEIYQRCVTYVSSYSNDRNLAYKPTRIESQCVQRVMLSTKLETFV
jgi:hypothetical protein